MKTQQYHNRLAPAVQTAPDVAIQQLKSESECACGDIDHGTKQANHDWQELPSSTDYERRLCTRR